MMHQSLYYNLTKESINCKSCMKSVVQTGIHCWICGIDHRVVHVTSVGAGCGQPALSLCVNIYVCFHIHTVNMKHFYFWS